MPSILNAFLEQLDELGPKAFAFEQNAAPDQVFRTWTWEQLGDDVSRIASALLQEGFGKGDNKCAAIAARNLYEWIVAELAIMLLGGYSVGVNPADTTEHISQILKTANPSFVFIEDIVVLEQLEEMSAYNQLKARPVLFRSGIYTKDAEKHCLHWERLLEVGKPLHAFESSEYVEAIKFRTLNPNSPAMLVWEQDYENGRGRLVPKSHNEFYNDALEVIDILKGKVTYLTPVVVNYHLTVYFERVMAIGVTLIQGMKCNLSIMPASIGRNHKKKPVIVILMNQHWEILMKYLRKEYLEEAKAYVKKRFQRRLDIVKRTVSVDFDYEKAVIKPISFPLFTRLLSSKLVRQIKVDFGFTKAQYFFAVGKMDENISEFFWALGIHIMSLHPKTYFPLIGRK